MLDGNDWICVFSADHLVVVELPGVRDLRLGAGELLLQREEVLVRLQVGVVLGDGDQPPQAGGDMVLGVRPDRATLVAPDRPRPGLGHVLEQLALVRRVALHASRTRFGIRSYRRRSWTSICDQPLSMRLRRRTSRLKASIAAQQHERDDPQDDPEGHIGPIVAARRRSRRRPGRAVLDLLDDDGPVEGARRVRGRPPPGAPASSGSSRSRTTASASAAGSPGGTRSPSTPSARPRRSRGCRSPRPGVRPPSPPAARCPKLSRPIAGATKTSHAAWIGGRSCVADGAEHRDRGRARPGPGASSAARSRAVAGDDQPQVGPRRRQAGEGGDGDGEPLPLVAGGRRTAASCPAPGRPAPRSRTGPTSTPLGTTRYVPREPAARGRRPRAPRRRCAPRSAAQPDGASARPRRTASARSRPEWNVATRGAPAPRAKTSALGEAARARARRRRRRRRAPPAPAGACRGQGETGARVRPYGATPAGRPTPPTAPADGRGDGVSASDLVPAAAQPLASSRTCTCTPPGSSQAYGQTRAILTAPRPGWNRCQSAGAAEIACSNACRDRDG